MSQYIKKLIAEGEHQKLDFKFEISDSRKIARTMVAFANTEGGRLLIGVKDNGSIAGVRSEEEFYMAEGASRLHCRPEVPLKVSEWDVDGRTVLEILIAASTRKPHKAQDPEGHWKAYVRQGDENFIANNVLMKLWARQQNAEAILIRYREEERILLEYLDHHSRISMNKFQRLAGIPLGKAETIIVNFILLGYLDQKYEGEKVFYYLR